MKTLIAFLFVACGATRLARFNVTTTGDAKAVFQGLPIPGAALALISFIYLNPSPLDDRAAVAIMLACTLGIALLMVSTIPFLSVKHVSINRKSLFRYFALLAAAVALVLYHHRVALMLVFVGYALSGPGIWVGRRLDRKRNEARNLSRVA